MHQKRVIILIFVSVNGTFTRLNFNFTNDPAFKVPVEFYTNKIQWRNVGVYMDKFSNQHNSNPLANIF